MTRPLRPAGPRSRAVMATAVAMALATAVGIAATPPSVGAQDTVRARAEITALPPAPPLAADGQRVRPRAMQYDVLVTNDSGVQHVGWYTVWIYDAVFAGQPAWEVSERRESHGPFEVRVAQDSVILARQSLAPLRWEAAAGAARFVAAFANDSVYGGATASDARATFTIAAPSPLVTSEGALDAMLRAASLGDGWARDASMLVVDVGGARILPLRLAVERSETVDVPAGRFDTWLVTATTTGSARSIWIDRRTGQVVRTRQEPPHMPGMAVERVLVGAF